MNLTPCKGHEAITIELTAADVKQATGGGLDVVGTKEEIEAFFNGLIIAKARKARDGDPPNRVPPKAKCAKCECEGGAKCIEYVVNPPRLDYRPAEGGKHIAQFPGTAKYTTDCACVWICPPPPPPE